MTEPTSITWLSLRPEYWSPPRPSVPITVGKLDIRIPGPIRGIACIAFAIGTSGGAWLDRLSASQWFSGLEPQPHDIERDDLAVTGRLLVRDEDLRNPIGIGAMLERITWPVVPIAAIAVPQALRLSDQIATLGLVSELRARHDGHGCRVAVVVTLGSLSGDDAFVSELLKRGVFVVRSGSGPGDDHLHHLPLRSAIYPRHGRLVCVDLADYLACWKPGTSAELHVLSLTPDYGHAAVDLLSQREDRTLALSIDMHWDPAAAGNELLELDWLAAHCRQRFLPENGRFLFTTSDRLHGETGTVDIVVITRKPDEQGEESPT